MDLSTCSLVTHISKQGSTSKSYCFAMQIISLLKLTYCTQERYCPFNLFLELELHFCNASATLKKRLLNNSRRHPVGHDVLLKPQSGKVSHYKTVKQPLKSRRHVILSRHTTMPGGHN